MNRATFVSIVTGVSGISDSRAEEAYDLLEEHGMTHPGEPRVDGLREQLVNANSYHEVGDHEYAAKFVRQALDLLPPEPEEEEPPEE